VDLAVHRVQRERPDVGAALRGDLDDRPVADLTGKTTATQAVGLLSILCSTEAFAALTTRHGWTADQCETWTTSALCQLLLRESGQAGV
jgi:hypothetical protein